MDSQTSHIHHAIFDNLAIFNSSIIQMLGTHEQDRTTIDFLNNHIDTGEELGDVLARPTFQGFCHNCVVCKSKALLTNLHSFIPGHHFIIDENSHQLRNSHNRMSIVQMEYPVFRNGVKISIYFLMFLYDRLHSGRDHKVFLTETKKLSTLSGIIRIQRMCNLLYKIEISTKVLI